MKRIETGSLFGQRCESMPTVEWIHHIISERVEKCAEGTVRDKVEINMRTLMYISKESGPEARGLLDEINWELDMATLNDQ
jgi:hypothetical protein